MGAEAQSQHKCVQDVRQRKNRTQVGYDTSRDRLGNGLLWVEKVDTELNKEYDGKLTVDNRGGSGRNSQWGSNNFADSVLTVNPDAVIIEFSVNDAVTRFDISPEQSMKNTDWMIRKVKEQNPKAEVILLAVSSNPVGKEGEKRPELASYIDGYHKLAEQHGLLMIDFSPMWADMIATKGEKEMRRYLHDGVHSTQKGATEKIGPTVIEALKTGKTK